MRLELGAQGSVATSWGPSYGQKGTLGATELGSSPLGPTRFKASALLTAKSGLIYVQEAWILDDGEGQVGPGPTSFIPSLLGKKGKGEAEVWGHKRTH